MLTPGERISLSAVSCVSSSVRQVHDVHNQSAFPSQVFRFDPHGTCIQHPSEELQAVREYAVASDVEQAAYGRLVTVGQDMPAIS